MKSLLLLILGAGLLVAQKANTKSPRATYSTYIGTTKVTVDYGRPSAKGRTVFGNLIKMGAQDNKGRPWRTGANENTTIEFSTDVMIEGTKLAAGKYGLFTLPGKDQWTLIFSKDSDKWGSFSYKKENDALRVTVKPMTLSDHVETFHFGMDFKSTREGHLYFMWEKTKVAFKITI